MKLRILWILVLILGALINTYSAIAEVDCSVLDPRQKVSKKKEGQIKASVKTLFKIAKASGDVKAKIGEEIENLQNGAPLSEQGVIKLRTVYLFCGMFANDKSISPERKAKLFKTMMDIKESGPPPEPNSSSKKSSHKAFKDTAKSSEKTAKPIENTAQTVIYVSSNNQSGGTAQTVNINLIKGEHDKKAQIFDEIQLKFRKKELTLHELKFISELNDKRHQLNNEWRSQYDQLTKITNAKLARCGNLNKRNSDNLLICDEINVLQPDEVFIRNKMSEIKDQLETIDNSLLEFKANNGKIIIDGHNNSEIEFNKLQTALNSKELTLEENKYKISQFETRCKLTDEWQYYYYEYNKYNQLRGSTDLYDDKLKTLIGKMRENQKHIENIDDNLTQLDNKKRETFWAPSLPLGKLRIIKVSP